MEGLELQGGRVRIGKRETGEMDQRKGNKSEREEPKYSGKMG